ncbi:riboflavin synthase [Bdellovibrio bacteriovorus]|uniref:riboflavin synthase n=1 Tax=Bdellovibrio bacteriovorus TaxID=959 RepID=UPI00045BEE1A|nr:riboflavin synthase [Bdellovibrio bacteriovorus]AHZ83434.1 riboflavin synthase subunit alpha [Bdellovibrio bacteriovorus]BEV69403.1 Riboflavin synthase [Bdellovibrio bacteriovorus]
MFSGIVESVMPIESSEELTNAYRIKIKKPSEFNDIKLGDSIACDGACLTVEAFDDQTMTFALAAETIKVLEWNPQSWLGKQVNLERSLRFGDRIHGHLVTGHVDSLGTVTRADLEGESFFLDVNVADTILPYVWKKGSVTLNGVSLTVNELQGSVVSVCLIPETLKRTNLGLLKPGSRINVEPDYMARAIQRSLEVRKG